MAGLIDYAGLFPPATLSLSEAVPKYIRYRALPDRWMLARFIIPAAKLAVLTPRETGLFQADDPVPFSLLGRGGRTPEAFLSGLRDDLQARAAFCRAQDGRVVCDVFEVRLPDAAALQDVLAEAAAMEAEAGVRAFYEVPAGPEWPRRMKAAIEAIAALNARTKHPPSFSPAGFKLRCGGVRATDFPAPARVAAVLAACRDAGVAMKATAGLHHPIRRFNAGVQTRMHGFLNVFGAGVLARVHNLDPTDIQTILEDENPTHFTFTEDAFAWQDIAAATDEIAAARRTALISYGSCSFDEPREDLRTLGLIA